MIDINTVKMPEQLDMNAAPMVDLSGNWNLTTSFAGQEVSVNLEILQNGAEISGKSSSMLGEGSIEGKVSADNFSGTLKSETPQVPEITIEGKFLGEELIGTLSGSGLPNLEFKAVKD